MAGAGDEPMRSQPLFGDNMSVLLPNNAVDVSDLREVPDNQEVFTHSTTDQSIIIEILERVDQPDEQAVRTHFSDVAESNDAADTSQIAHVETIPTNQLTLAECTAAYFLSGQQQVAKFKESAKNTVNIHMAVYRLQAQQTDVVVTFNDPVVISPQSSSHLDGNQQEDVAPGEQPWTLQQFRRSVQTLKIHDISFLG